SGPTTLAGGTIQNMTVTGSSPLNVTGGILSGVTLNDNVSQSSGALSLNNGLTFQNGHTLAVGGSGGATLEYSGTQSIGGSGTILFAPATGVAYLENSGTTGTMTFGPGIALQFTS